VQCSECVHTSRVLSWVCSAWQQLVRGAWAGLLLWAPVDLSKGQCHCSQLTLSGMFIAASCLCLKLEASEGEYPAARWAGPWSTDTSLLTCRTASTPFLCMLRGSELTGACAPAAWALVAWLPVALSCRPCTASTPHMSSGRQLEASAVSS
jgi:hypothetical protein